jgi:predicted MFS family arabinose efflux permease
MESSKSPNPKSTSEIIGDFFITFLIVVRVVMIILSITIRILKSRPTTSPLPSSETKNKNIKQLQYTNYILNYIFMTGTAFVIIWYFNPGRRGTVSIKSKQKTVLFMLGLLILITMWVPLPNFG